MEKEDRRAGAPDAAAEWEAREPSSGFMVVAGPCVLEDAGLNLRVARHLRDVSERTGVRATFKASFDKANRTSGASARGPGLERGLALLAEVRAATDLPLLTDVHEVAQVEPVSRVADVLQIPAFLSRQTDLLLAAGACGRAVNVKKGQWMAPEQVQHSVAKVRAAGCRRVVVTERGTAFGYGRWVVDMRAIPIIQKTCRCSVLFDATHSVQLPGGGGAASDGEPEYIEPLARAAVAAGADGLFVEIHPDPRAAPSDGSNMLPMDRLEPLLALLVRVREAVANGQ